MADEIRLSSAWGTAQRSGRPDHLPFTKGAWCSAWLSEARRRFKRIMLATDIGVAKASPSSHGKLSQHSVADDRRVAFAVARKGRR